MAPPSNYRRRVTKAQQAASERYYKHLGGMLAQKKKVEDRRYAAKMKRDRERAETAAHNSAFFGTMGDIFSIGKKAKKGFSGDMSPQIFNKAIETS